MSFLAPHWFILIVPLLLLVALYVVMQFRRKDYAVKFTNLDLLDSIAPERPEWRRHVPAGVFALAALASVLAMARPSAPVEVPRERATIIMAIDTSLSMMATDIDPSRIDAAKAAAIESLDLIPERINVGLVSFNGIATVQVLPTTDRVAVQNAISRLELGESTATGEAIFASLDAINAAAAEEEAGPDDEPTPARIVLLSDGTRTVGREASLATAQALEAGVPVSTIAFGTQRGEITIPQEPFPIPVPVDEPALRAIAEATEGRAYTAFSSDELEQIYADIGSSIGTTTEDREITSWFLGAAFVLFMLTGGLSLLWFNRLP